MRSTFFSRHALAILCLVFFLIPFGLRGARLSLSRMKNDVKDWLPEDFKETAELKWFARHFAGERFVVATWPGCTENDPRFDRMLRRLEEECEPLKLPPLSEDPVAREDELARRLGAELGLFFTGDYYENWGGRGEKWLLGGKDRWYYVTPDGLLYRWDTGDNVVGRGVRTLRRRQTGEKVRGILVEQWQPANGARYFEDPRRLTARLFRTVLTGPAAVERMAVKNGAVWPRGRELSDEEKQVQARRNATQRLTGSLFGRIVPEQFEWTVASLEQLLPAATRDQLGEYWKQVAEDKLQRIADLHYDGDRSRLRAAPSAEQTEHWYSLCDELEIEPPPPLSCLVVTLSGVGKNDLKRVVGRPILGKPRGQLQAVAEECGISALGESPELRIGGPPVDNVAIDEEGSITLLRLLGFSLVIGIVLSYLSFRSIPVTIVVFMVGGVAAVTSLALAYWLGDSVDAILLSMPSLVYVLGLSGAVHIINYYRDAAETTGLRGAPEQALAHGWGPCTLAAFTTALGLLSLYASTIIPIRKFGFYAALSVMATLILLFTYLPAAIQLWPPGYHKRNRHRGEVGGLSTKVAHFWDRVGDFIIRRYAMVIVGCTLVMFVMGLGLSRIETSVQLLKLFSPQAKIIHDYEWLERHIGELVPMEVVLRVPPDKIRTPHTDEGEDAGRDEQFRYSLLARVELTNRIQTLLEREFGEQGQQKVGRGISAATFVFSPPPMAGGPSVMSTASNYRRVNNRRLEKSYDELLDLDYLRLDTEPEKEGTELWRISLRIGALKDVDYGLFVHQLADVVEPALSAYRLRDQILHDIDRSRRSRGEEGGFGKARIMMLGAPYPLADADAEDAAGENADGGEEPDGDGANAAEIDQTAIFSEVLHELLVNAGSVGEYAPQWHDPRQYEMPEPDALAEHLENNVECIVLVSDHEKYDVEFLKRHARVFVDATDHKFIRQGDSGLQMASLDEDFVPQRPTPTAAERDDGGIDAVYTGIVPVVYKAQRVLLYSLAKSIGWAFVMIAAVMMVLLRSGPLRRDNLLSFRAGLLSMVPNVFPVLVIFGAMGHMRTKIDIGSMMTASVAMGVAVDDTIHFLTWFRSGVRKGLGRLAAIKLAYERCATAMTQTTLIGGVGLSVFAVSTFTPTQRFGVLMLVLLAAALIGDLIFLPAILASPWGRFFAPRDADAPGSGAAREEVQQSTPQAEPQEEQLPAGSAAGASLASGKPGGSVAAMRGAKRAV